MAMKSKKNQRSKQTDELFLVQVIHSFPEIVYIYDLKKLQLIFINQVGTKLLGYSQEEFTSLSRDNWKQFTHPQDIAFIKAHFQALQTLAPREQKKFVIRVKDAKETWRWMECIETVLDPKLVHRKDSVLGIARDITESVKTSMYLVEPGDQELKKEYRCRKCQKLLGIENYKVASLEIKCLRCGLLNTLFNNYDQPVFITDKNGVILFMNEQVEQMTGYTFKDVVGKTPAVWGKQMQQGFYKKLWDDILNKKKSVAVRLTNRHKNGSILPVILRISPILNEKGDVEFFLGLETLLNAGKIQS